MQTAIFKPRMQNKKLRNVLYSGQLTTRGAGVPPPIISGIFGAKEINKQVNCYERTV